MKDFLLEIGCENIPPSYVKPAARQLANDAEKLLETLRLAHGDIYTTGAARRLVLIVRDLSSVQEAKSETITGPPVSKSYEADGSLSKAAVGFAKSKGISASRLKVVETERGEYIGFTRKLRSRKADVLLKETLPDLIAGLRFPKTMRWDGGGVRFARPIRWLVCMHGSKVIGFRFAGVKSSNVSFKVPWLKRERVRIASASSYVSTMKKAGIIVDQTERRQEMERIAVRLAEKAGLKLVDDPELFEELTFMIEEPRAFIGEFPEKYLALPPEVLITAMKAHQKYFSLRAGSRKLEPRFLAFFDGGKDSPARIKKGNEKVLKARLEDAMFYWREDLKRGIRGLSEKLESIVFIEGLGSVKDKASRITRLMEFIDSYRGSPSLSKDVLERLPLLAKADLASEMIKDGKEFTLLEGLIGSHYAEKAGESREIVRAIREQYYPRSPSDPLPKTLAGTCLNLADKVDSICGCFIKDLAPTGSQDPYALRRHAFGLIRILEKNPLAPVDEILKKSLSVYEDDKIATAEKARNVLISLKEFFKTRLESYMKDRGIAYDIVDAVIPVSWAEPASCIRRARSIQKLRREKSFQLLITGVKRVGNILPEEKKIYGASWDELREAMESGGCLREGISFEKKLFAEEAEKILLRETLGRIPMLMELEDEEDFEKILEILSGLAPHIDDYFDKVLVNCEDMQIRKNRINFLAILFSLFSRYAAFSAIVESD